MPTKTVESETAVRETVEYVVTAGMISYRTGRGKNDVTRFRMRSRLRLFPDDERTIELLHNGSIMPADAKGLRRLTPMAAMRAMGSIDDPAAPPIASAQPISAGGAPVDLAKTE